MIALYHVRVKEHFIVPHPDIPGTKTVVIITEVHNHPFPEWVRVHGIDVNFPDSKVVMSHFCERAEYPSDWDARHPKAAKAE